MKLTAFELPPPGVGLATATLAETAAGRSVAGLSAVSEVGLAKIVARFSPFHVTIEPGTNPEPVTVKVKSGLPTMAEFGLMLVTAGTGLI